MADNTPKTAAEAERAWWDNWRRRDFSWDGLAYEFIPGSGGVNGEVSLSDYWRRDPVTGESRTDETLRAAGELVASPTGEYWHIAHIPLTWSDGAPTWKANEDSPEWEQLSKLIESRLAAAQATEVDEFGFVTSTMPDGRAQLTGVVLRWLP